VKEINNNLLDKLIRDFPELTITVSYPRLVKKPIDAVLEDNSADFFDSQFPVQFDQLDSNLPPIDEPLMNIVSQPTSGSEPSSQHPIGPNTFDLLPQPLAGETHQPFSSEDLQKINALPLKLFDETPLPDTLGNSLPPKVANSIAFENSYSQKKLFPSATDRTAWITYC